MTLLQFLRQARQTHLQFLAGKLAEPPIYVLGNPSADLDSIVSAIIYSYCANNRLPKAKPRLHIPLLNLPNVPSGSELFRLRPEFVTALQLSTNFPPLSQDESFLNNPASASPILQSHLVTIADFANALTTQASVPNSQNINADLTLVDWNALPEPTSNKPGSGSLGPSLPDVLFHTLACIDHHVDEHFVPHKERPYEDLPLTIEVGPGSCSSLIADTLRERELLGYAVDAEDAQVAKLLLAAIMIDTSNLKAEGKVTEVDKRSVEFLRGVVKRVSGEWDLEGFYKEILRAKKNSLDLLTLEEVLDRDFKEWVETTTEGKKVKLGFCSSVKPVRWIVKKAGDEKKFLDGVQGFARGEGKELDVVVVMTSFTNAEGEFERELFIAAKGERGLDVDGIEAFVRRSAEELQLLHWEALDGETVDIPDAQIRDALNGDKGFFRRLWIQKNRAASRKQVAPLLREAVAKL